MNIATTLLRRISLFVLTCVAVGVSAAEPAPPNFILINIDDLGYADIGPFGSTLNRTPNLDRMAAEGLRFTSFYAAPVCSPSRAALMTGSYPKRALPIPHVLFPVGTNGLSPDEITVAEVLKTRGYRTAIVGKWHLGDQPEFFPTRQGFDEWFGLPYSNDMGPVADGVRSNFGDPLPAAPKTGQGQPPLALMRNETVVKRVLPDDQTRIVSLYTDEAVRFIRDNRSRPFFLYLAHNAVHFPLYPGERFRGKSANGLYGDWVEEMDWSVGQVLDQIRELGLSEKTLVLFTSDNGGTPRGVNRPLRGHKSSNWEGGMRVPTIAWWPGRVPAGATNAAIAGMFDILPTFAALAGAKLPPDRKLDGRDQTAALLGKAGAKPAHERFYYFTGLKLNGVRQGDWKLLLPPPPANQPKNKAKAEVPSTGPMLFNLATDPGESTDLAEKNPEIVAKLQNLMLEMDADLGTQGTGPGVRALGRVEKPKAIIDHDGTVRTELQPKKP